MFRAYARFIHIESWLDPPVEANFVAAPVDVKDDILLAVELGEGLAVACAVAETFCPIIVSELAKVLATLVVAGIALAILRQGIGSNCFLRRRLGCNWFLRHERKLARPRLI